MNIPSISLLIKPSSHLCNLNCAYCFYKRVSDVYPKRDVMTKDTLEALIKKTLSLNARLNSFTWQGGEPMLMGIDFYREATRLQDKYRRPGQVVENSLQTNGVLIDEGWADFLKRRNFLVGLSLDGPKEIHDHYRKDPKGGGTFQRVIGAARLLEEKKVPFNILVLLTDKNVGDPEGLYRFFRGEKFTHLQFIPCLEYDPKTKKPFPFSVSAKELGSFHARLFDMWMDDGFSEVSVRIFEDIFLYFIDGVKASCGWLEKCGSYLLVEHNGDIYPCDFFVYPKWKIGNIINDSYENILKSPLREEFGRLKAKIPDECTKCRFLSFCRGDCTKFRWNPFGEGSGDSYSNISTFCEARKMLLSHIEPRISEVKDRVMEIREGGKREKGPGREEDNIGSESTKLGRNDPCPCGSGRKYKKCCGK